jgi:hypothetical protein
VCVRVCVVVVAEHRSECGGGHLTKEGGPENWRGVLCGLLPQDE